jgi:hypothetical protein
MVSTKTVDEGGDLKVKLATEGKYSSLELGAMRKICVFGKGRC